jgi:hypothetical protein
MTPEISRKMTMPTTMVKKARPSSASAWRRVRAPGAIHDQKIIRPAAAARKIE